MIKPRNSLVVVRLIEKQEQKVGKIVVSTNSETYTEAEIIAVGPGSVLAGGARSETFDLGVGQRVLVKHKKKFVNGNGGLAKYEDEGLPYRSGEDAYVIFEQGNILGIVAEPA